MADKKVFILGSCVSRDPFELTESNGFNVVEYFARHSLASLMFPPFVDHEVLERINSRWQRRMVKYDMDKRVLVHLEKDDFDVLLLDFIDERFHLSVKDGHACTVSTEYKKADITGSGNVISRFSNRKFALWKQGLMEISKKVDANRKKPIIIVNKVYWTKKISNGNGSVSYSDEQIDIANNFLAQLYSEVEKIIPSAKFIKYPEELFFVDEKHKWGIEPFHYNNALNSYMLLSLKNLVERKKESSVNSAYGRVFNDFVTAYKFTRDGFFFIKCNEVLFPFQWKISSAKDRDWVFFLPGRTKRGKPVPVFQRSSYFSALEDLNCISCFDPLLFEDDEITLGWFIGDQKNDYIESLKKLWNDFFDYIDSERKVLFFATSGGGIAALKLACSMEGSIVYLSNIQTNVFKYEPKAVNKFLRLGFNVGPLEAEKTNAIKERMNIYDVHGDCHLYYAQNLKDVEHTSDHFLPWIKLNPLSRYRSVSLIEYFDRESGHGPLSRENEISIIYDLLRNKGRCLTNYIPNVITFEGDYVDAFLFKTKSFPDYKIELPINWAVNPFKSQSWCVKYYGLSWLLEIKSSAFLYRSILSISDSIDSYKNSFIYEKFREKVEEEQVENILALIQKKSFNQSAINAEIVNVLKNILEKIRKSKDVSGYKSAYLSVELLGKEKKIASLARFLKQKNIIVEFQNQIEQYGFLSVPSIYTSSNAVCSSSFYIKNRNFLIFKDELCGALFLIVQDFTRGFPFLIIDLLRKQVISNKASDSRALSIANLVLGKEIKHSKEVFRGYINSYARPYHYFLEKAPYYTSLINEGHGPRVFSNSKKAFLSFAEVFQADESLVEADSFNDGFYIDLFRTCVADENKITQASFKERCIEASQGIVRLNHLSEDVELVVWLGVCAEKRAFKEQREFHSMLFGYLNKKNIKYAVIFDGLTSCVGDDVFSFRREFCKAEMDYVKEISREVSGDVINLIGCKALEKIYFASKVDFFATNALTDSIWVAWFFDKKGIAYAAKGSKILLPHLNTKIVPESEVENLNHDGENWSESSFSINPDYVFRLAVDLLDDHPSIKIQEIK